MENGAWKGAAQGTNGAYADPRSENGGWKGVAQGATGASADRRMENGGWKGAAQVRRLREDEDRGVNRDSCLQISDFVSVDLIYDVSSLRFPQTHRFPETHRTALLPTFPQTHHISF